jgi:hypothetical protein
LLTKIHTRLARALDALLADAGPLTRRLGRAAAIVATLSPGDFDDFRLRRKFRELRDAIVMLDLPDGASDLDAEAAMLLALRILDLVFAVAQLTVDDD